MRQINENKMRQRRRTYKGWYAIKQRNQTKPKKANKLIWQIKQREK